MMTTLFSTCLLLAALISASSGRDLRVKRGHLGGGHGGGQDVNQGGQYVDDDRESVVVENPEFSGYSENARSAASIALQAAEEAHRVVAQQGPYSAHAAHQVRSSYASHAQQAAQTAHAALAGKQAVVNTLQQSLDAAQAQVAAEVTQLESAQRTNYAAQTAASQAAQQMKQLNDALNAARGSVNTAQNVANQAAQDLASQERMVYDAKERAQQIYNQLRAALSELEGIQRHTERASYLAQSAAANVARSAGEHGEHGYQYNAPSKIQSVNQHGGNDLTKTSSQYGVPSNGISRSGQNSGYQYGVPNNGISRSSNGNDLEKNNSQVNNDVSRSSGYQYSSNNGKSTVNTRGGQFYNQI